MILVLAGPNGSGKSTISQYFDIVGEYTNADDVVASTGMDNVILHVYDNTIEPTRIIRKHKDDISIFANELWSEEQILALMQ
jgi:predicted ABC-type ATPase